MENSELDLLVEFKKAGKDKAGIKAIAADMAKELQGGCQWPELLPRLAQYELALTKFYENNLGASSFGVFANKCWPAFESEFGFVPCFINSRLAGRGIPVACEVDLYGAISEYMLQCATGMPATLLDINNSVPADILKGANLSKTNLSNAVLYGSMLVGANLSDANLEGASLFDADLEGANLEGANLNGTNITDTNFKNATLSPLTTLPSGKKATQSWAALKEATFISLTK